MFFIFLILLNCLLNLLPVSAWSCLNSCGGVPVQYPFGTGWDCGSQVFQEYVNCSNGRLQFYTPTGTYYVQSIDYVNNLIVIQDPHMSTCSYMQKSQSFGLPINAPFSVISDTFVLLDCTSTASLYNPTYLCNPSGFQICQSLYNSCPSLSNLGLSASSPISSCCVYSKKQLPNQPFQINLPLLQCSSYTSIYSFGPEDNNKNSPNTWSYGIVLKYYYDQSGYYRLCNICQQTSGVCAFNDYGFVCVCNNEINSSTHCSGGYFDHGSMSYNPYQALKTGGLLSILLGTLILL